MTRGTVLLTVRAIHLILTIHERGGGADEGESQVGVGLLPLVERKVVDDATLDARAGGVRGAHGGHGEDHRQGGASPEANQPAAAHRRARLKTMIAFAFILDWRHRTEHLHSCGSRRGTPRGGGNHDEGVRDEGGEHDGRSCNVKMSDDTVQARVRCS